MRAFLALRVVITTYGVMQRRPEPVSCFSGTNEEGFFMIFRIISKTSFIEQMVGQATLMALLVNVP